MNLKNFLAGVELVMGYYIDPCGYHLGAEHDEVYLYATDLPMTSEDVEIMMSLGWTQPYVDDEEYDPSEGWCAFV